MVSTQMRPPISPIAERCKAEPRADDLAAGLLVSLVTAEETFRKLGAIPTPWSRTLTRRNSITRLATAITPPSGEY